MLTLDDDEEVKEEDKKNQVDVTLADSQKR